MTPPRPVAWIISVGNELLIGRVVNTNASWLAKRLTEIGFRVRRIVTTPDDEETIEVLREAVEKGVDLIVSTGGLGPTYDDKTLKFIADATKRGLELNRDALKEVEEKYRSAGLELTEHRVKMAMLPEGSTPIRNPVGTAPGAILRHSKTTIIALPGVPSEMQAMFELVENDLRKAVPKALFCEEKLVVVGLPESSLAPLLDTVVKDNPGVYLKSHPRGVELGQPVVEVVATGETQGAGNPCRKAIEELRSLIRQHEQGSKVKLF